MDALPFLGLAAVLGVKHAFDPDHIVAVAALLGRSGSTRGAARLGASWAVGHTAAAGLVTVGLFLLGREAAGVLRGLEFVVAAMLVALGAAVLAGELSVAHAHRHAHGGVEHEHRHLHLLGRLRRAGPAPGGEHRLMLGIGVVHGFAGNDELLVLFTAALGVTSLGGLLLGVAAFSAGVVVGMVAFAAATTWPALRSAHPGARRWLRLAAGAASLLYGAWMLAALAGVPGAAAPWPA